IPLWIAKPQYIDPWLTRLFLNPFKSGPFFVLALGELAPSPGARRCARRREKLSHPSSPAKHRAVAFAPGFARMPCSQLARGSPMAMQVCMGAMMMCTMGIAPSSLVVLPTNMVMTDEMPDANIMDFIPMVNIMTF